MELSEVHTRLAGLSAEALLLWRQILDRSVRMPCWEARSKPVQDLVSAGLIFLWPADCGRFLYTAVLSSGCFQFGLTDLQRDLMTELTGEVVPIGEYLKWAEAREIENRLEFVRNLMFLGMVKTKVVDTKVVLSLN